MQVPPPPPPRFPTGVCGFRALCQATHGGHLWVALYRAQGEAGLHNRSSRQHRCPVEVNPEIMAKIEVLRRERTRPARWIQRHFELSP
ncbi:leucine zipper domain-containing protein [Micrococcus luteus]|uniref:leucine zipper domain-containing protein n=1 Tax=Micrococcus luteus TaxID=1270 RepID=UPI003879E17B